MAPISLTHAGKYKYPECVVQSNISENRHHLNDTTLKIINPTGEIWKKTIKFVIITVYGRLPDFNTDKK